jgi:Rrf2 family protein
LTGHVLMFTILVNISFTIERRKVQLSTRARYGLRALLDIALSADKGPVLLRQIAARQELSRPYLEQLILALQSAGFIRSIRGKKGGFILVRNPSEITLDEVVKALERTVSLVQCVNDAQVCSRSIHCATRKLWARLTDVMHAELKGLTLSDLMEWQDASA